MRPNRAAPRLAGRGDPSPRGCPPYAPRAGGSQPAPRALFLHWRPYTKGRSGHWSAPTAERRRAASMSSRAKAGCTAPRAGARCQQPLRADSPARPRLQYYSLQCGLLCTGRRCTTPLCASRGGRVAREGAASRAICSSCHGARAGVWAHWSIGSWIAAVRAGGRIRLWAVRTWRARNPRAPCQSTRTQAALQTAQQPCRSTCVTR